MLSSQKAVKKVKKEKKGAVVTAAEAPTLEAGTPPLPASCELLPATAFNPARLCVLLAFGSQAECAYRRWHSYRK